MIQNESQEALGKLLNEISDLYGFKTFAQGEIERLRARIANLKHSYPKNKIEDVREAFKLWSSSDMKIKKPAQIDAFFLNQVMRNFVEYQRTLDRPRHLDEVAQRKEKVYTKDEKWFSNLSIVLFTYGDWLALQKDLSYPKIMGMQFTNVKHYLDRYTLFDDSKVDAKTIRKRYEENRYITDDLIGESLGIKLENNPTSKYDVGLVCEYFTQLKEQGITFEEFRAQLFKKNESAASNHWSEYDSFWYNRIKEVV